MTESRTNVSVLARSRVALSLIHDRLLYGGALVLILFSVNQRAYAPKQGIHTVVHVTPADVLIWLVGLFVLLPVFEKRRAGRMFTSLFSAALLAACLILSHYGHAFVSVLHHGRHSGQFKAAVMSGAALALGAWQLVRVWLLPSPRAAQSAVGRDYSWDGARKIELLPNGTHGTGSATDDGFGDGTGDGTFGPTYDGAEPAETVPPGGGPDPRESVFRTLPVLPLEVWALLIAALLSGLTMVLPSESLHDLLHSPDSKDAVRKAVLFLVELFQHLAVALYLFLLTLQGPGRVRLAVRVLILASTVCAAAAIAQYLHHAAAPDVRGFMQSRKAFGGLLCMVLPLVLGSLLGAKRRSVRAVYGSIIALMLVSILSGAAFFSSLVGLVITAVCRPGRSGWRPAAACGALGLLILVALPRNRQSDALEFLHMRARPAFTAPGLAASAPTAGAASSAESEALPGSLAPSGPVLKKEYVEWIAGIYMMSEHFWLGVGPGQYQLNIGQYYGQDPNPAIRLEPDSNNLYFVYGASIGFVGLAALCQVLIGGLRRSWRAARTERRAQVPPESNVRTVENWWRSDEGTALAAGVLGSIVAFTLVNLFTNLFVRAAGIDFAFLLALAILSSPREREPHSPPAEHPASMPSPISRHGTARGNV